MKLSGWLIGLTCIGITFAWGEANGKEFRWTHYGLRPLAMGNAFVSVANDYNALFYNPAGLARLEGFNGELLNVQVTIADNTVSAAQDVSSLASGDLTDSTKVLKLLEENTGKTQHIALSTTPHFVMPRFGLAIGTSLQGTLAFHREISPYVNIGMEVIAPVAVAANFLEKRLSVGIGAKLVLDSGVDREFSINDIEAFQKDDTDKDGAELSDYVRGGIGGGIDLGLLYTPTATMKPTIGLSVIDLGGTSFKKFDLGEKALGVPKSRQPTLNTGLSLQPWQANNMYVMTSIEAHGINRPEHYSKKFNLGAEWGYSDWLKVQSGLYQGELSGGFELDVMLLSVRFATYAEQLGTVAGQHAALSNRRYALQLKLLI